ncbi:hypothetical protein [Oerskovia sp. Root22]|uniref:hypothetical protein n=1 Tax=Oerskovia sp. Root22 TaxID=1736494 RepID=UPI0006FAB3A9|nr:hypothetical protein [Oerskovia sp. Root22]KRC32962.1 hypothetical protein ASE15_14695 [Oerskovia sp. Root22]
MISLSDSTDPDVVLAAHVMRVVQPLAVALDTPVLLVGATARTVFSIGVLEAVPSRQTKDVDIAIAVDSWAAFARLTAPLRRQGPQAHRFVIDGIPVDIVPFGPLETARRTITWPDEIEMSAIGFHEAATDALHVALPDGIIAKIPSPAAQCLLKLVAWNDRRDRDTKDAVDLRTMLSWFSSGPLLQFLYSEHFPLVEAHDFDPVLAGAEHAGRMVRSLLNPETAPIVSSILAGSSARRLLAQDMGRSLFDTGRHDHHVALIDAFHQGMSVEST